MIDLTGEIPGLFDGTENMAKDVELLDRAEGGIPSFRVYGWNGPWVTLGRFQTPERSLLDPEKIQWVKRPTGGKAVLHGHDVTLGIAMPLRMLGLEHSRSVAKAYQAIIQPIIEALRTSGARVSLAETTPWMRSRGQVADCFAHVAPNDGVDPETGQKVIGCALKLTQQAMLVQASIPAGPPLVDPAEVFPQYGEVHWVNMDAQAFREALRREFARF